MDVADEIAREVTRKLRQRRFANLNWAEKGFALLVSAAAIATAVHSWVH